MSVVTLNYVFQYSILGKKKIETNSTTALSLFYVFDSIDTLRHLLLSHSIGKVVKKTTHSHINLLI